MLHGSLGIQEIVLSTLQHFLGMGFGGVAARLRSTVQQIIHRCYVSLYYKDNSYRLLPMQSLEKVYLLFYIARQSHTIHNLDSHFEVIPHFLLDRIPSSHPNPIPQKSIKISNQHPALEPFITNPNVQTQVRQSPPPDFPNQRTYQVNHNFSAARNATTCNHWIPSISKYGDRRVQVPFLRVFLPYSKQRGGFIVIRVYRYCRTLKISRDCFDEQGARFWLADGFPRSACL